MKMGREVTPPSRNKERVGRRGAGAVTDRGLDQVSVPVPGQASGK